MCVSADYYRHDEKVTAAEASERCWADGQELASVGDHKHWQVCCTTWFFLHSGKRKVERIRRIPSHGVAV